MDIPQKNIWYHGTENKIDINNIKSLYLTPYKNISKMHGNNIYSFFINKDAKWLDLDKYNFVVPSMDGIIYNSEAIKKLKDKKYDIIWDSEDYKKGHLQIFVINPNVLLFLDKITIKEEKINVLINKIVKETLQKAFDAPMNATSMASKLWDKLEGENLSTINIKRLRRSLEAITNKWRHYPKVNYLLDEIESLSAQKGKNPISIIDAIVRIFNSPDAAAWYKEYRKSIK